MKFTVGMIWQQPTGPWVMMCWDPDAGDGYEGKWTPAIRVPLTWLLREEVLVGEETQASMEADFDLGLVP